MERAVESSDGRSDSDSTGLICVIGRALVAIPAKSVARIVEYDMATPLPLGHALIGGLGVCEGKLLVSVSLSSGADNRIEPRRRARGVIVHAPRAFAVEWAVEIDEVGAFSRVHRGPVRGRPQSHLPSWVDLAETAEGLAIGWIDVPTMIDDLSKGHGAGG
jgi:chemotaxis signal transduction protein